MARRLAAIDPAHQISPRTMSRRRFHPLVALACIVPALSFSARSNAIEWGAEPSIGVGTEYNDNIFLTTAMHEAVWGFTLSPSLDLSARQEAWELRSSTQLTDRRYINRSDLDADNGTTSLSYLYRTERNQLQLKGAYTNEATWASSHIDSDIGLVQTNTRRATTLAEPTWNWLVTETIQLSVDYQWTAVTYENGIASNLLDYQQWTPSLTLSDQITPRTSVSATLAYADFEVTTPPTYLLFPQYTGKSRSNYAQVGIAHQFTETLKGSFAAGPRKTTQTLVTLPWVAFFGVNQAQWCNFVISTNQDLRACDPVEQNSVTHGTVYSGSIESALELTHTTLSASREINASGSGSQVETTNVKIRMDRQLTQDRLGAWFLADGYLITALGPTTVATDRHYYSLSTGLNWRWTEYLSLDTSYRYQRQRYVGQNDYAKSNAFYVSLTYRWPKFSVSR